MYYACATSFFHFGSVLYLSSGHGKGVIFLSFDSSFMWCEQFCPGKTLYFDAFYFIGKLKAKIQKPPCSHLNIANIRCHYI